MNAEKQLVEQLLFLLVDDKEKVKVECTVTSQTAIFDIYIGDADVPVIIGKGGRYADALRTILTPIYAKMGKRLHLHVTGWRNKK